MPVATTFSATLRTSRRFAVDPTDPNKMAIGWRQFNSVTSNFRQAGYGYTTNGGTTWTFPGVLENNVFRSDPVLNSDETGNFFYLSLQSTQTSVLLRPGVALAKRRPVMDTPRAGAVEATRSGSP